MEEEEEEEIKQNNTKHLPHRSDFWGSADNSPT
jgi:hypothetical protein